MSVLDTRNIRNVIYNNIEVDALYKGSTLIWERIDNHEFVVDMSKKYSYEVKNEDGTTTTKVVDSKTLYLDTDALYIKNFNGETGDFYRGEVVTDWGDGFVNTETEHTYNYKGKFTVKTLRKVRDNYSTSPETFSKHKIIEVKHVSTLPYNIEGLFANCYNLEKICTIDFKSVYNARGLFSRCTSLKSIPDDFKFNFTSYTKEQWEDEEFKNNYVESFEIDNMFYETGIENVPDGIFSSIQGEDFYGYITCNSMFYNTPIKEFNIQLPYRINDCSYMFKNCTQLASIRSLWNDQYEYGVYLGKDSNYMGCLVNYTFENCTGIITIDGQPGTLDEVPNVWKDTYSNN